MTASREPFPEVHPVSRPPLAAVTDDGARALAILAELEQPGMPTFQVHQARPLSNAATWPWEYYAAVWLDGELQKTGRSRSIVGCLASVVGMVREARRD